MNIKLNLKRHCIETEVKRLYNKALSQCLKPGADIKYFEKHIEVLKKLLEECDFSGLRDLYPELRGHSEVEASLRAENIDEIYIIVSGRELAI